MPQVRRVDWLWVIVALALVAGVSMTRSQRKGPEDAQPPVPAGVAAVFQYHFVPESDVVGASDAVVVGTVSAVSDPFWNQDSGQEWSVDANNSGDERDRAVPFPLQDVTVTAEQVWLDRLGLVSDAVSFVVLGTGIGEEYNQEGASLIPGTRVVVCLQQRPLGWREGGRRLMLTLSGAYQGVYRVVDATGHLTNAAGGDQQGRSSTISELREVFERESRARQVPSP